MYRMMGFEFPSTGRLYFLIPGARHQVKRPIDDIVLPLGGIFVDHIGRKVEVEPDGHDRAAIFFRKVIPHLLFSKRAARAELNLRRYPTRTDVAEIARQIAATSLPEEDPAEVHAVLESFRRGLTRKADSAELFGRSSADAE